MKKNTKLFFGIIVILVVSALLYTKYQKSWPGAPSGLSTLFDAGRSLTDVTVTPKPALPPLSMTISDVDKTYIYLQGERGKLRLSNDSSKVSVFERVRGQLNPTQLASLRQGLKVTVISIIPGSQSHIIIEK